MQGEDEGKERRKKEKKEKNVTDHDIISENLSLSLRNIFLSHSYLEQSEGERKMDNEREKKWRKRDGKEERWIGEKKMLSG